MDNKNVNQDSQGQNTSYQMMNPAMWQASHQSDDEIDLLELLAKIWRGRFKIAAFVFVFTLLGGVYAFTATKWYTTEFKLIETKEAALYSINNSELVSIDADKVLNDLAVRLFSPEHFSMFYQSAQVASNFPEKPENLTLTQYSAEIFSKQFTPLLPKEKKGQELTEKFIGLKLEYPEGVSGSEVLNKYLNFTDQVIKQDYLEAFNNKVANEKTLNLRKMDVLLTQYKKDIDSKIIQMTESDEFTEKNLLDKLKALKQKLIDGNKQRIQLLNENIAIAKKLNYKKPTSPSDVSDKVAATGSGDVIRAEFSSPDKLPLYFRGYESLMAEKEQFEKRTKNNFPSSEILAIENQLTLLRKNREIEKLKSRKDPRPFLGEYQTLEKRNGYLDVLSIDVNSAKLFQFDVAPLPATKPIKPKKVLIVILAAILGGFFGLIFVLLRTAVKDRRAELTQS